MRYKPYQPFPKWKKLKHREIKSLAGMHPPEPSPGAFALTTLLYTLAESWAGPVRNSWQLSILKWLLVGGVAVPVLCAQRLIKFL